MIAIEEEDIVSAWIKALEVLNISPKKQTSNLILNIRNTQHLSIDKIKKANNIINPNIDIDHTGGVAETIFPAKLYLNHKEDLLKTITSYIEIYERDNLKQGKWGTYAYRIFKGELENYPIIFIIKKLNYQKQYKSTYEIPITTLDKKLYGGPCLQHLSFKKIDGKLHVTALYRSHDYTFKALGNMIGIARLQHALAKHTNLNIGEMTIHSSYATAKDENKIITKTLKALSP